MLSTLAILVGCSAWKASLPDLILRQTQVVALNQSWMLATSVSIFGSTILVAVQLGAAGSGLCVSVIGSSAAMTASIFSRVAASSVGSIWSRRSVVSRSPHLSLPRMSVAMSAQSFRLVRSTVIPLTHLANKLAGLGVPPLDKYVLEIMRLR